MTPRREGRPVTVRLHEDVIAQIDERRSKTGHSRAESLRTMILWALAQPEAKR
jgi:hypothetical protein